MLPGGVTRHCPLNVSCPAAERLNFYRSLPGKDSLALEERNVPVSEVKYFAPPELQSYLRSSVLYTSGPAGTEHPTCGNYNSRLLGETLSRQNACEVSSE